MAAGGSPRRRAWNGAAEASCSEPAPRPPEEAATPFDCTDFRPPPEPPAPPPPRPAVGRREEAALLLVLGALAVAWLLLPIAGGSLWAAAAALAHPAGGAR